jgi:hypothetical protein
MLEVCLEDFLEAEVVWEEVGEVVVVIMVAII